MINYSQVLQLLLKKHDCTQKELAKMLNCCHVTVNRLVNYPNSGLNSEVAEKIILKIIPNFAEIFNERIAGLAQEVESVSITSNFSGGRKPRNGRPSAYKEISFEHGGKQSSRQGSSHSKGSSKVQVRPGTVSSHNSTGIKLPSGSSK